MDKPKKTPAPKATRFPVEWFRSKSDFKLYEMACDQIDANVNCDWYMKPSNNLHVKMDDGSFKQFFMK